MLFGVFNIYKQIDFFSETSSNYFYYNYLNEQYSYILYYGIISFSLCCILFILAFILLFLLCFNNFYEKKILKFYFNIFIIIIIMFFFIIFINSWIGSSIFYFIRNKL